MRKTAIHPLLLAALSLATSLSFTACVGKKKFLREVSTRDNMVATLNTRVLELNQTIAQKDLRIAEISGENKALREQQDKLDGHINRLKLEVEKLTNQSLSQQSVMDMALKRKQEELAAREAVLENMHNTMVEQEMTLRGILDQLKESLANQDLSKFTIEYRDNSAIFAIPEPLLFRPGTTTPAKTTMDILKRVAEVLNRHPEINIMVKGHTDNQAIKGRSISENWDFSAQRAAYIVRMLTNEYYLNPSQLTLAGKGEYEPSTSNETADGKEKNRRVEFILTLKNDKILKLIENYPGKKSSN